MSFNSMKRTFSFVIFTSLMSLFFVGNLLAQAGTSTIRGTVTDPQGKAIAGANVTLKSESKSFSRSQITNAEGIYVFTAIPPDTYRVEIEASGFKKSILPSVQASVDSSRDLNIVLELGQVTETVTVSTATEETLNTTNASLGNTFDSKKILDLPLSARNTPDLLSLQPGVTPDNGTGNGGAVNGGRSDQANVTLDGVDVNEQQGGRAFFSVLRVTPEALQEFRVTTTNADANAGRSSGGQISLITKSGSNEWHGSGYFYYRPSKALQANDFFNNLGGVEQPSEERRNYGGSFGGPIKKDKWFFFFNYERFEENAETSVSREVPLPSLGQGIVRYRSANGASDAGCPSGTPSGVICLTPAEINAAYTASSYGASPGINSAALTFLAGAASRYVANDPTVGDGLNTSGFRFNAKTPIRNNVFVTRLDGKLTDNQDVFGRFQYQFDNASASSRFPDTISPNTWVHPIGVAGGHTWTINSSMVNKFTYGLTRDSFTVGGDSTENLVNFRFIYQPFTFSRSLSRVTPVHNFVDDFTWVKGNHTISFGGNLRLVKNSRVSTGSSFDTGVMNPSFYDFSGDVILFDDNSADIFSNVSSGSSVDLRDALTSVIGRYSQISANVNYGPDGRVLPVGAGAARTFKTEEFEFYAQDSWKMFSNLTFNYGLRWSTSTPVYEANGVQVAPVESLGDFFDKRVAGAANGTPFNGLISVDKAGKANNKPGYYSMDWNNFAPSVSVAWSPNFKGGFLKALFGGDNKSTIRGGFRMTYDRIGSALAVAFDGGSTLGFASSFDTSANDFNISDRLGPQFTGLTQNLRTAAGFGIPGTLTFPLQTPADEAQRIEQSLDSRLTTPYHYNFNVSYGRELWKGISVEASYVGRIARNLLTVRDTAHFNNLRDPASGQDFYSVMSQLIDLRNANTPITSAPANIPWVQKFLPGLAGNYTINGVSTPLTASQAAYRRVARSCSNNAPRDLAGNCTGGAVSINGRNTTDYTFVQLLWDDGLGPGGASNLFIHPQYATFAAYSTIGTSDYHAGQLSVRKRFSQGLAFDINYTYAHSLDISSANEQSGGITGVDINNPLTLSENRGSSDFDVRHLINANFIYELPMGKGKPLFGGVNKWANLLVGGWQLTGIYRWNTGFPIGEPFDDGRWATNWNVQSNGVRLVKTEASPTYNGPGGLPNLFSDPTAVYRSFRNPKPGENGDRNVFREPNYVTLDLGLFKSFNINENHKITFRFEAFNVTNTQRLTGNANRRLGLDPFVNGVAPSDWGRFTAIQGNPRIVQIALRYDF